MTAPADAPPPPAPALTSPPRPAARPAAPAPVVVPPGPARPRALAVDYAALGFSRDGARQLAAVVGMPTLTNTQVRRALAAYRRRRATSPARRGTFPLPANSPEPLLALLTQADLDLLELALWQNFDPRRPAVTFTAPLSTRGLTVSGRVLQVPDRGHLSQCFAYAITLAKGAYRARLEAIACADPATRAWVIAEPSNARRP